MKLYKIVFLSIFSLCVIVDIQAVFMGHMIAGVFLLLTTLITSVGAYVWFIHQQDYNFHFQKPYLLAPVLVITAALIKFHPDQTDKLMDKINLLEVGQLLMSRYQGALWILGMLTLTCFIFSSSILDRGKRG